MAEPAEAGGALAATSPEGLCVPRVGTACEHLAAPRSAFLESSAFSLRLLPFPFRLQTEPRG